MKLVNFRKETSERSDELNWSKKLLINNSKYYFDSIEGCNQNMDNVVTHLLERARVDYVEGQSKKSEILREIIALEGVQSLQRKINFCSRFDIPLSYVLYNNELEKVFLFNIHSLEKLEFISQYDSFKDFSNWIATIKGWSSSKPYRESIDLPYFDKELRKHKTAWPTNIDCFFCNEDSIPIGIIEFQNAKNSGVLQHCNNDHFQCKLTFIKQGAYGSFTAYSDDIRRWTSQEILRVQSELRLFIITWSQYESNYQLKELQSVAIPYVSKVNGTTDWQELNEYKKDLHEYVKSSRSKEIEEKISRNRRTYNIYKHDNVINYKVNEPILSYNERTFPSLYYDSKIKSEDKADSLIENFERLVNS